MYIVVGLGNPGEEYARTRHNTGRMCADFIAEKVEGIKIFTPDTFMNKTGSAVAKIIKSKKAAEKLIVIYDDLDLPLGTLKISYNRGSGGHKGLESIIKAIKTREFIRIRIGIGKKKDVEKHILGNFTKSETDTLKKVFKKVSEAVEVIVEEGREIAMNQFN
ncbi:MAG: hypothetical protein A2832_01960 [Candidatus Zambryskibacteria bacterium RIFCSPHIGHO2_01_FULL_44_22b]|uniref:Peptidyl-tRNA hydrolase n=2 Tax=Candidatus Zambryskiibacteriota TaxID=1817925 RepID=A0A1G2SY04_9BACT|nr:MAG: hypothetical protein A2832_01960 [Candidatus Zambryskibacteria bacterium RIFCSPHIGHO2_01_FULL_44_22b]OHB05277.1 MAG: hypothetical protein A3B16_02640 [Candidatus Zambryskibacteria bacterium RIFCSPLOWO2_01_FULL_45_43]